MPEQVALAVGPAGATGGPIAAALARSPRLACQRHVPPRAARRGDPTEMIREQLNQYRDAKRLPL